MVHIPATSGSNCLKECVKSNSTRLCFRQYNASNHSNDATGNRVLILFFKEANEICPKCSEIGFQVFLNGIVISQRQPIQNKPFSFSKAQIALLPISFLNAPGRTIKCSWRYPKLHLFSTLIQMIQITEILHIPQTDQGCSREADSMRYEIIHIIAVLSCSFRRLRRGNHSRPFPP